MHNTQYRNHVAMRPSINIVLIGVAIVCLQNLYVHFWQHRSFASCVLCVDQRLRMATHFAHEHCSDHEEAADYTSFGTMFRAILLTSARPIIAGYVWHDFMYHLDAGARKDSFSCTLTRPAGTRCLIILGIQWIATLEPLKVPVSKGQTRPTDLQTLAPQTKPPLYAHTGVNLPHITKRST